jgi:16S rRNA (uracil1498-N3)-methyltransferase
VVERHDRAAMITLFWTEPFTIGETRLRGAPAEHARARRVERGNSARLVDGRGRVAFGEIASVGRGELIVTVDRVVEVPRPSTLEVIVPVADRDRMLLAAEKCVELQVTAWRPTYFARSRSVSPRGEGQKFREKVRARMQGALEQSGSAWLPDVHEEMELLGVLTSVPPDCKRFMLDANGAPLSPLIRNGPVALAVGPEGGTEHHEIEAARSAGWTVAAVATTILRFETAIVAGAAVVRAAQLLPPAPHAPRSA